MGAQQSTIQALRKANAEKEVLKVKFWLAVGVGAVGAAVAVILYDRWRREKAARTLAEYRMSLLEGVDMIQCVVCMQVPKEVLLDPCGHVCVCADCLENLVVQEAGRRMAFRCPVCRSWVRGTRKIYMA